MKIIESATGKTNGTKAVSFIKFKFDKGCSMIRYEGGREQFFQANNYACRDNSPMIDEMRTAVATNARA